MVGKKCQYGVVASQPVCGTLFALKMAPVEGRNVRSMLLTSCLTVIFGSKFSVFVERNVGSQLLQGEKKAHLLFGND